MNPNPEQPLQQPGWFSRNWKWLLPVGCFVPLMCCGVFGLGTYLTVSKVIESSPAYVEAFSKANQNPEVTAALGTPITPGFGISGSINQKNDTGTADFNVPLKGTKGEGSMHVVGYSNGGAWVFSRIDVTVGGKTIDVLAGEKAKQKELEKAAPEEPEEPEEPDGD